MFDAYSNVYTVYSKSLEYELLTNPAVDSVELRNLSDVEWWKIDSMEAYYTECLSSVLLRKYGIIYRKGNVLVCDFLLKWKILINGNIINSKKRISDDGWLYLKLPRK